MLALFLGEPRERHRRDRLDAETARSFDAALPSDDIAGAVRDDRQGAALGADRLYKAIDVVFAMLTRSRRVVVELIRIAPDDLAESHGSQVGKVGPSGGVHGFSSLRTKCPRTIPGTSKSGAAIWRRDIRCFR